MNEMVERVGRAICCPKGCVLAVVGKCVWSDHDFEANAAIASMREPNKAMCDSGFEKLKEVGAYPAPGKPAGCNLWAEDMGDAWRAMIDEALKSAVSPPIPRKPARRSRRRTTPS